MKIGMTRLFDVGLEMFGNDQSISLYVENMNHGGKNCQCSAFQQKTR